MTYEILTKLYYKNQEEYQQQAQIRRQSPACQMLPVPIAENQAFFCYCPELVCSLNSLLKKSVKIRNLFALLPKVARHSYSVRCLIDEIILTNEIERIHCTRQEINQILIDEGQHKNKDVRLRGLVLKYKKLILNVYYIIDLYNAEDLRVLYDEIVLPEIAKADRPDGLILRKGPVSVVSPTDKEKHRGMAPPEENIIAAVNTALALLQNEQIPKVIAIALLHYYLGYIHPFYDGNGRLSRFISSYLLQKELEPLIALRLSYAIKNNIKLYYDTFDTVNNKKNLGDCTPFILMFLNMLNIAADSLIEQIGEGRQKLEYYQHMLLKKMGRNSKMSDLAFVLIQSNLFYTDELTVKQLAETFEVSVQTMNQRLKQAQNIGLPLKIEKKGRHYFYSLDLEEFEEFCKTLPD